MDNQRPAFVGWGRPRARRPRRRANPPRAPWRGTCWPEEAMERMTRRRAQRTSWSRCSGTPAGAPTPQPTADPPRTSAHTCYPNNQRRLCFLISFFLFLFYLFMTFKNRCGWEVTYISFVETIKVREPWFGVRAQNPTHQSHKRHPTSPRSISLKSTANTCLRRPFTRRTDTSMYGFATVSGSSRAQSFSSISAA